jgi:hypothetical protein
MRLHSRLFAVLAPVALGLTFGAGSALADSVTYDLVAINAGCGGLCGPGPYGTVTVTTPGPPGTSTTATIVFQANSNNYAFVDGTAAGLNVAGSFTVGSLSPTISPLGGGHSGTLSSDLTNSGDQTWGSMNLRVSNSDGWGSALDSITIQLTNGSWASAASVLTNNSAGYAFEAHIGYCSSTAAVCSASTYTAPTGYSTVPIPAAAWLFGSGLIGLIGIARRKLAA